MKNAVLLIVDVQNALINAHPYNKANVIRNIKRLIQSARNHGIETVYVRHQDDPGEEMAYGKDGWQIYHELALKDDEKIFEKHYNSAFVKTNLKEYLDSKKITDIILAGLQTEYCIDATCKSAFEHGYHVIIPEEANTTFDNEYLSGENLYEFYNFKIWNNRFANVMSVKDVEERMKSDFQ